MHPLRASRDTRSLSYASQTRIQNVGKPAYVGKCAHISDREGEFWRLWGFSEGGFGWWICMCAAYSFKILPQLLSVADPWDLLIVIFGLDCLWECRGFRAKDLVPDRRERTGDALPSLGILHFFMASSRLRFKSLCNPVDPLMQPHSCHIRITQ